MHSQPRALRAALVANSLLSRPGEAYSRESAVQIENPGVKPEMSVMIASQIPAKLVEALLQCRQAIRQNKENSCRGFCC